MTSSRRQPTPAERKEVEQYAEAIQADVLRFFLKLVRGISQTIDEHLLPSVIGVATADIFTKAIIIGSRGLKEPDKYIQGYLNFLPKNIEAHASVFDGLLKDAKKGKKI
jgi:hypothetical protein